MPCQFGLLETSALCIWRMEKYWGPKGKHVNFKFSIYMRTFVLQLEFFWFYFVLVVLIYL